MDDDDDFVDRSDLASTMSEANGMAGGDDDLADDMLLDDMDDEDFDEGDYYDDEVEPEDERKDFITLDDF